MKKYLLYFSLMIILSVILNISFTYFYNTPIEKGLIRENKELATKYFSLQKEINNAEETLNDIQQRDDYVYRSVFELNPIASSVRNAGLGGVNRYSELESYKNSEIMISTAKKLDKITRKVYIQSKSFDEVIDVSK
ncbi:MAG: M23 family peptidase, partial [Bacteroidota bacterium]|nr:M23 family peptidase [Bacteroidota bacterium]